MPDIVSKCKIFLFLYFGILGFHFIEEGIWIAIARFTDVHIAFLYLGIAIGPLLLAYFIRRYHRHGH